MEFQTQIVKFFTGTTRDGSKQKWDVYLGNGQKVTAWEYPVAALAEQAYKSGQQATVTIEEKPSRNGGAPFLNLTKVVLSGHGTQSGQNPSQTSAGRQSGSGGFSGGMSPEDKIRVTKLSCISSAAAIFSGSGDVEATLKAAVEIFNSVYPQPEQQPAIAQVAQEPQAVQQFVNEQAGSPVVAVGAEQKAPLPWAVA